MSFCFHRLNFHLVYQILPCRLRVQVAVGSEYCSVLKVYGLPIVVLHKFHFCFLLLILTFASCFCCFPYPLSDYIISQNFLFVNSFSIKSCTNFNALFCILFTFYSSSLPMFASVTLPAIRISSSTISFSTFTKFT